MSSKTVVKYNRSTREWQAINGAVQTFPAGKDGKRAALLAALNHDYPRLGVIVGDLAEMHNHRPELVDRLIKAAQLVTRGHVYSDHKVKSQTTEEVYNVTCEGCPQVWHCDCEDFTQGQARRAGLAKWGGVDTGYGLMCKHTLARLLAELAQAETVDEPIPF